MVQVTRLFTLVSKDLLHYQWQKLGGGRGRPDMALVTARNDFTQLLSQNFRDNRHRAPILQISKFFENKCQVLKNS